MKNDSDRIVIKKKLLLTDRDSFTSKSGSSNLLVSKKYFTLVFRINLLSMKVELP